MTELKWQEFVNLTIRTNDLDPMYEVFWKMNMEVSQSFMGRFLMHFLLFYDAGEAYETACQTKDHNFWKHLWANYEAFKRGTERRHFRGENGRRALSILERGGSPWKVLMEMYGTYDNPQSYTSFYNFMTSEYKGAQFGPYFIWKLFDIFNVCLEMPISITEAEAWKYMPDEPKKYAVALGKTWDIEAFAAFQLVHDEVIRHKHPFLDRPCGYAETETILCMMKGYFGTKKHVIGDDIDDKFLQLAGYPQVQALLPPKVTGLYGRARKDASVK